MKQAQNKQTEEKKLMMDKLRFAQNEIEQLKDKIKKLEVQNLRLEKKMSSGAVLATKNILADVSKDNPTISVPLNLSA